jgi:excinuclease ABC subunit C
VLNRLYTRPSGVLPKEILIPVPFEDMEILEDFLSREKGSRVHITAVQRGERRHLIDLAYENARQALKERLSRHVDDDSVVAEVQRTLTLRRPPARVEAFDISNIQGTNSVASMVVWDHNHAAKDDYRRFKIKSFTGSDDFRSMFEVVTRRYSRVLAEQAPLPDLILIDGGKGQVNVARAALDELGISATQVDVIGLAKGRTEERRERRFRNRPARATDYEYVVKPELKGEIELKRNSATLHFLQRIRDESHRFAIAFHRSLRKKEALHSELEEFPGIGKKRVQALLRHFGSLKRVREASLAELKALPGLPAPAAQRIFEAYHAEDVAPDGVPGHAPDEAGPDAPVQAAGVAPEGGSEAAKPSVA